MTATAGLAEELRRTELLAGDLRQRQRAALARAEAAEEQLAAQKPILDALGVLLADVATNTAPRTPAFQTLIDAWLAFSEEYPPEEYWPPSD